MLKIGIKNRVDERVKKENTASAVHSGELFVYATPAMIALMETTAYESVAPFLEEGESTVGTLVNVSHIAATPIGMDVYAESELVEVDGRRLVFRVAAFDEVGKIGEGLHERFIISKEKFQERTDQKKKA